VLTGEHKREYMREYMRAYMRRRRAAENAGQPVSRVALEAEVERLREQLVNAEPAAKVAALEAEVERLTEAYQHARTEIQDLRARLRYAWSQVAKEKEIAALTALHEDARAEIKHLRDQLRRAEGQKDSAPAWGHKGGSPLPPQVVKMLAHLGNENEHERLAALKKVERALKEKRLNWSDVANRLRSA
jgi:hypothetical protein